MIRDLFLRALLGKEGLESLKNAPGDALIARIDKLDSLLLGGGKTNSGAVVNEDTAMRYAAVYTAVRILSEVIGMLPCHLMRSTGDGNSEKATDHPLFHVLHRLPNPWQTSFEFWRHLMVCLLLRGNFFGYITRDGNGRAREIIPIHPDRVAIKMSSDYELQYVYTPKDKPPIPLKRGEMLHIRAVGSDGILGMSPVTQAREAIGLGIQIEKSTAKMYANGARLGIILTHPEIVEEEVANRIARSFDQANAGADNHHKTVLLEEGIKVEKIGMTAEDAQFLEMRKYQRGEVLALFGVPPHMAGDTEKTTSWGSGIEQQTIGFVTFTIMPWLVNIEQALYRDVLTEKERKEYYPSFNSDAIIRGDIKSRYEAHKIGIETGFLNPNEVRAMEKRNTVAGLDEFRKPGSSSDKPNDSDTGKDK